MTSNHDDQATLWSLIKDIKFGMFTHRHEDGMLHSAPLTTQNGKDDQGAILYFFISRASDIAHCVARDGNVNVSYAHPGDDSYVSISGAAAIVENSAKKEALFTSFAKAWFPGGPTDPDLALLEVAIEHAEYWDVKESKMMQLAKMAKAAITGKPPSNMGEHKEIKLN
ncbi:MAG: pyridoxamine 5'-phosphate oxidase family protein [Polaromonas sp.]|nr:pyridoxamine 5'-phosphate oxidase family protein [Polaromonas sp.]